MGSDELSDAEFAIVQELMAERSGQNLEPHRRSLCLLRLKQLAESMKIGSASELVQRLGGDESLRRQTVDSLLNGETSFFRDPHAFQALETNAIPELMEADSGNATLRIWCAACSSGQEPYSVAMLLSDSPIVRLGSAEILATDYSTAALERARAGRYSQLEVNRGLPAKLLVRHFERAGREWTVRPALRTRVRFDRVDLTAGELPMGAWDLILLRNVLIYFPVETKQRILKRVVSKLAPHGLILFGGSETALGISDELVPAGFGHGFFRKQSAQ